MTAIVAFGGRAIHAVSGSALPGRTLCDLYVPWRFDSYPTVEAAVEASKHRKRPPHPCKVCWRESVP